MNFKRALVFIFSAALVFTACRTIQYVPVEHTEYVHVHDTTYFRDTTIKYQIEKERYTDYVGLLDTLKLSTDYASAQAYIDTTANLLKGSIESKPEKQIVIRWKEKEVVRDSIVYKEKPVPVEVVKVDHKMTFLQKLFFWLGIGLAAFYIGKIALKYLAGKGIL